VTRSFSDVTREFDELFLGAEKTASTQKKASFEEVDSLVEQLRAPGLPPTANNFSAKEPDPLWEKVAEGLAFAETIANLPALQKIAAFEERALEEGYSEEQISKAFSKTASSKNYRSIMDIIFS
jgi:hypothetical protein